MLLCVDFTNKGFIVTLSYGLFDQHTVAACSMFTQMCWLRSFNLGHDTVIVEPFANMSHFEHTPELWTAVEQGRIDILRFSDYFSLEHLHSIVTKEKSPLLVEWEYFLDHAPRDVVAISIEGSVGLNDNCFGRIGKPNLACRAGPRNQAQIDYFLSGCGATAVDNAMKYLQRHGFRVVKNVCLNCGHGLPSTGYSPNDIMNYITDDININSATFLFNHWIYSMNLVKNCEIFKYCSDCVGFNSKEYRKLVPSDRLQQDAQRYLTDVLNATSVSVAIMIRIGRLFRNLKTTNKVFECLDSVLNVYVDMVSQLAKKGNDVRAMKPVISIDAGTFGSDTYGVFSPSYNKTQVIAKFEDLLAKLYSKKWTFEQYENALILATGGVKDSGYVAGLQRWLASQAKCLVLCGAGHYQALADYFYQLQHPNKAEQCIHRIKGCGF